MEKVETIEKVEKVDEVPPFRVNEAEVPKPKPRSEKQQAAINKMQQVNAERRAKIYDQKIEDKKQAIDHDLEEEARKEKDAEVIRAEIAKLTKHLEDSGKSVKDIKIKVEPIQKRGRKQGGIADTRERSSEQSSERASEHKESKGLFLPEDESSDEEDKPMTKRQLKQFLEANQKVEPVEWKGKPLDQYDEEKPAPKTERRPLNPYAAMLQSRRK